MSKQQAQVKSPIGNITLFFEDEFLVQVSFVLKTGKNHAESTRVTKIAQQGFLEYFKNANFKFNLPIKINGTIFQKRIWQELKKIPIGETITYGELALKLKTSPRVIGNACRANPLPIIIPCHRVVGKNGLGGYAGKTKGSLLSIKKWLLRHEGLDFQKGF